MKHYTVGKMGEREQRKEWTQETERVTFSPE